jgi:HEAT repeat protein
VITQGLLIGVSVVVALTALGLTVLVVAAKLARTRRERVMEAALAPHRMSLLVLGSGEDDDGAAMAHLLAVDPQAWRTVGPAVTAMLAKVRGEPVEDLVLVLREHGDIDRALSELRARSVVTRARAAYLLGLVRDRSHVPHLLPLLRDRSAEVRLVAVRALGAIGDPAAAGDVLRALHSVRGHVGVPAFLAAEALLAMGTGGAAALREGLDSDDPTVRNAAALVAGRGTFVSTAPRLRELVDADPDPEVRATASAALGFVGGGDDVATLARHTAGGEPVELRRTCAAALGEVGHPLAADALAGLLADPDRRLAQIAADALVQLGPSGITRLTGVPEGTPAATAARGALQLARLRSGERALA